MVKMDSDLNSIGHHRHGPRCREVEPVPQSMSLAHEEELPFYSPFSNKNSCNLRHVVVFEIAQNSAKTRCF